MSFPFVIWSASLGACCEKIHYSVVSKISSSMTFLTLSSDDLLHQMSGLKDSQPWLPFLLSFDDLLLQMYDVKDIHKHDFPLFFIWSVSSGVWSERYSQPWFCHLIFFLQMSGLKDIRKYDSPLHFPLICFFWTPSLNYTLEVMILQSPLSCSFLLFLCSWNLITQFWLYYWPIMNT